MRAEDEFFSRSFHAPIIFRDYIQRDFDAAVASPLTCLPSIVSALACLVAIKLSSRLSAPPNL